MRPTPDELSRHIPSGSAVPNSTRRNSALIHTKMAEDTVFRPGGIRGQREGFSGSSMNTFQMWFDLWKVAAYAVRTGVQRRRNEV